MHKEKVIVIGASGHAKVVVDIIQQQSTFELVGLVDTFKPKGEILLGAFPNIGNFDDVKLFYQQNDIKGCIIAVGDNWLRSNIALQLYALIENINFINAIHPKSTIAPNVKIGKGNVIAAGAIINSNATIGNHCIINTKSSVDHDGRIGEFVSLSPGVTLGGGVEIGDFTAVAIGATIIEKVKIGSHNLIAAGAVVVKNIENDNEVWMGLPATKKRTRQIGEKYLK